MSPASTAVGDLLRDLAPQVLAALVRRRGAFADAEDAVQEALVAATLDWADRGIPDNPRGWLLTVADRRLIDGWRSEAARRRREWSDHEERSAAENELAAEVDDSLELLLLCCHPVLTRSSQVALTLRAVGGLSTEQIASAYLVPTATIAQRISRAKASVRAAGGRFERPGPDELPARVEAVAEVLYLVFTEGHTASSGENLIRLDLSAEAIRLTRMLSAAVTRDPGQAAFRGEAAGLLALMLLTDARRAARVGTRGELVPLDAQDRTRWDPDLVAEGVDLVTRALATERLGPYQVQAAIAAVHAEAPDVAATDWPQILALYDLLVQLAPGPMVSLNRVVALAMVDGPGAGLLALEAIAADPALAGHHRVAAVRAQLLELAGQPAAARAEYLEAARTSRSIPERAYLEARAARLGR